MIKNKDVFIKWSVINWADIFIIRVDIFGSDFGQIKRVDDNCQIIMDR
jgi:hypothetical protein